MLTLAVLEITSIYKDRNEHDTAQANIRKEQLQQFTTIVDKQQSMLNSQSNMMTFLINQPKLTEANVRAVVQAYSKPQNSTGVPPASNSELHRDVSEYTAHLREIEANRDMWYQKFLPETNPMTLRNYQQQQQAVDAWNMVEVGIEREFIDKDLGHGVSLQAELLSRLHEIGPPKPMNALLGVFPEPRGDNGPRGRPFEELANYLDALASGVPYF